MLMRMFDGADPVAAPVKESAGASRAVAVEKQEAAGLAGEIPLPTRIR